VVVKILTSLFVFITFGLCATSISKPIHAQEGINVSPVVIEEEANPGDVLDLKIKILSGEDTTLYTYPVDFKAGQEETGVPQFMPSDEEGGQYSLSKWIKLGSEPIDFKAGEKKEIPVRIEIPANAEPGGHYGAVIISIQDINARKTGMNIAGEVGTLILIRVSGAIKEEGSLVEFKTAKPWYEKMPASFVMRFQNSGNVHLKPFGNIEIFSLAGKKMATLQVNPNFGNVLPDSIRKFTNEWKVEKAGIIPLMGKFSAQLLISYGAGQTAEETVYFWIIPYKWLIAVFGGVVVLIGLVVVFGRKFKIVFKQ